MERGGCEALNGVVESMSMAGKTESGKDRERKIDRKAKRQSVVGRQFRQESSGTADLASA